MTNRSKGISGLMRVDCRNLLMAALAASLAFAPALAQEAQPSGTVGPPQLREFQLPGRTTTPAQESNQTPAPAPQPSAPAEAPVPVIDVAPPPVTATPNRPVERPTTSDAGQPQTSQSTTSTSDQPVAEATPETIPGAAGDARGTAQTEVQAEPTAQPQPEVEDTVNESGSAFTNVNWLLVALAGLGVLAALAAFAALRRSRAARLEEGEAELAQPVQAPLPDPVPARPTAPTCAGDRVRTPSRSG